jgi:hypothetical protein
MLSFQAAVIVDVPDPPAEPVQMPAHREVLGRQRRQRRPYDDVHVRRQLLVAHVRPAEVVDADLADAVFPAPLVEPAQILTPVEVGVDQELVGIPLRPDQLVEVRDVRRIAREILSNVPEDERGQGDDDDPLLLARERDRDQRIDEWIDRQHITDSEVDVAGGSRGHEHHDEREQRENFEPLSARAGNDRRDQQQHRRQRRLQQKRHQKIVAPSAGGCVAEAELQQIVGLRVERPDVLDDPRVVTERDEKPRSGRIRAGDVSMAHLQKHEPLEKHQRCEGGDGQHAQKAQRLAHAAERERSSDHYDEVRPENQRRDLRENGRGKAESHKDRHDHGRFVDEADERRRGRKREERDAGIDGDQPPVRHQVRTEAGEHRRPQRPPLAPRLPSHEREDRDAQREKQDDRRQSRKEEHALRGVAVVIQQTSPRRPLVRTDLPSLRHPVTGRQQRNRADRIHQRRLSVINAEPSELQSDHAAGDMRGLVHRDRVDPGTARAEDSHDDQNAAEGDDGTSLHR